MQAIDALELTQNCFAILIVAKGIVYFAIARKIYIVLGTSRIRLFWQYYARSEHLLAAAWRLGAFFSLLIGYMCILIFLRTNPIKAPIVSDSIKFWIWLFLIILLITRTILQNIAEWSDLNQTLETLINTLKIKASLKYVGHAVTVLSLFYPIISIQGWIRVATWSQRAIIAGKGIALFEKWFDRKVHGELRQFLLATLGAAIIETILKLLIVGIAISQANENIALW